MNTNSKVFVLLLLACIVSACSSRPRFVAPEIDPPADLIPGYLPAGFTLDMGFQIAAEEKFRALSEVGEFPYVGHGPFWDLKSPEGNDILGVFYQKGDQDIMITKSYFPGGNLDIWRQAYEASTSQLFASECIGTRMNAFPVSIRFAEIQEERSIAGTDIIILNRAGGTVTVFMRGDYLLTIESSIALEENLKIVKSLLEK